MKTLIVAGAGTAIGAFAVFISLQVVGAQTEVGDAAADQSSELRCALEAQQEYLLQSPDVAEVTASRSTAFMGPEREEILAKLAALDLPDGTSFVVAHEPSMDVYVQTCSAEKCTGEEFYEPELACLREHLGGCHFAAVKFKETTYCLLRERS